MAEESKELVSVIVPVYNAERYLEECLDSILAQTYQNLEIILVDDGSKDRSPEICDAYAGKDCRIRVIHQENQGVSAARNRALAEASGTYVAFCDSDDAFACNMIACLASGLFETDADMSGCAYTRELGQFNQEKSENSVVEELSSKETAKRVFRDQALGGYLWNKLFKREILERNRIFFNQDISVLEDQLFVVQYLQFCKKCCYTKQILYFYRDNESGACNQTSYRKTITAIVARERIFQLLGSGALAEESLRAIAWNDMMRSLAYYHKDILKSKEKKSDDWFHLIHKKFRAYKGMYAYDDRWNWKGKIYLRILTLCAG